MTDLPIKPVEIDRERLFESLSDQERQYVAMRLQSPRCGKITIEAEGEDPKGMLRQIWEAGKHLRETQDYIVTQTLYGLPDRSKK